MNASPRYPLATLLIASSLTAHSLRGEDATVAVQEFRLGQGVAVPSLSEGGFASAPTFEDDFSAGWEESQKTWRVATWKQNAAQMSPERCRTDGKGHLVQTVLAGEPFRGGSLQTDREFGYGRWIARVKPSSVPGILNSIFTKDWDDLKTSESQHDGRKAEVDIEFLTYTFGENQGQVHLAIHLLDKDNFWSRDVPLNFNPSDDFHEWGFDILPDCVVWHVDGKTLATWHSTKEGFIDPAYEFFFNSWTQQKWIKGPPSQEGDYLIDWVKFYPLLAKESQ